jgi:hypothetical protein
LLVPTHSHWGGDSFVTLPGQTWPSKFVNTSFCDFPGMWTSHPRDPDFTRLPPFAQHEHIPHELMSTVFA